MKPIDKIHTTSLSLAAAGMFGLFKTLLLLSKTYPILALLCTVSTATLIYRLLFFLFVFIAKRSEFVKKILLGPEYTNGTWVGYYIGAAGQQRYYIERHEQEIDKLTIRGTSKDENQQLHGSWDSVAIFINKENGSLSYMYQARSNKDNTTGDGIAFFTFERKSSRKAPHELTGYSIDSHIGKRCRSEMKKISNHTNIDKENAFNQAQAYFTERYIPPTTL